MTRVLSRKEILKAKFFRVFEETLEIPNGERRTHKTAFRDPAVSVFPLDDKGNIYLIDQYRYLHEARLIEAVAGMIEDNLTPLKTAQKELKEEAGLTADTWTELGIIQGAGSIITWDQIIFLAQGLTKSEQELEDSEDIKVLKVPFDEAVEMVLSGKINTGSSSIGILMIDKLRQQGKI